MNKKYFILFFLLLVVFMLGCNKIRGRTLYVYHWEDYISPDVVAKFEKKYNCKVEIDIFTILDELNANIEKGDKVYDVIFPSSYSARQLYEKRLLRDIDHSKIPNLKNLDPVFLKKCSDPENKYSVPYMISFTGIAYNKNKVKDFRPSWTLFNRADLSGKTGLLNDEREVIGAASKSIGYSYNGSDDIQLRRAADIVSSWKRNKAAIGDHKDLERGLASGQYDLIQDYNGDALSFISEHPEIAFVLPEEGLAINLDTFAIPFASNNTDLAYAFINFFLDAENAKDNMLYLSFMAPNLEAKKLLPQEFLNNQAINPPDRILSKSEHIVDLGDDNEKYRKIWESVNQ